MSRTNKTETTAKNPAQRFLEWKSSSKAFAYYDKEAEEEVEIPHNKLSFIVLDQLNTAKGWSDKKGGLWANEVRSVGNEPLTIRCKDGVVAEGFWKEVKATDGIKFVKSVYAMAKIGGEYEMVNLQLKGSALKAWFDFCEQAGDLEGDIVVGCPDTVEGKNGAVTYHSPAFTVVSRELSSQASTLADEMDGDLQTYLRSYFKAEPATEQEEETETTTVMIDTFEEDAPF